MALQIATIDGIVPDQNYVYRLREYPVDTKGPNWVAFEYGINVAGGVLSTCSISADLYYEDVNGVEQVIAGVGGVSGSSVGTLRVPVNMCNRQSDTSMFELRVSAGGVPDGALGFVTVTMTPADPSCDFMAMNLELVP